ncbi:hypothetical protein [uncultured Kordia sp.]|uniref:hypothetical protein n=1 Tax=uncultured Kordia sp. TaxID=507699 RepID=UPI002628E745|nr:hypothetical protein [uncultured Kordia sp.]
MSQQFGIMIMIDVKAALKTRNLKDHVYLIDNMKDFGSQNEGTNALISKVNGTYWADGTQAGEEVMNWLAIDINDMPRTVQKPSYYTYFKTKAIESFLKNHLLDVREKKNDKKDEKTNYEIEMTSDGFNTMFDKLQDIANVAQGGLKTNTDSTKNIETVWPLVSVTGEIEGQNTTDIKEDDYINLPPIVTNITGEAVDLGIIYPAQYGSPNFITEGWYWCATVNTAKAGKYRYTAHITLFDLVTKEGKISWKPVQMTFDSHILISRDPMRNGFTGAGDSYLPIY